MTVSSFRLGLPERFRASLMEDYLISRGVSTTRVMAPDPRILRRGRRDLIYSSRRTRGLLGRDLTDGEISASIGHRRMLRHFLRSDSQWGLFLEDDAEPKADLGSLIRNLPSSANAPMFIDLFGTGDDRYANRDQMDDFIVFGQRMFVRRFPGLIACGYILNKPAGEILYSRIRRRPIASPADWPPEWLGACRFLEVAKPLVMHPPANFGSLLQADRSKVLRDRRHAGPVATVRRCLAEYVPGFHRFGRGLRWIGAHACLRWLRGVPFRYAYLHEISRL